MPTSVRDDTEFVRYSTCKQLRSNRLGRVGRFQAARVPGTLTNNFPVTVKITTSGYQTLECFTATLPT